MFFKVKAFAKEEIGEWYVVREIGEWTKEKLEILTEYLGGEKYGGVFVGRLALEHDLRL